MRLLVTGASGKLGGYVVKAARASGHEVVAWAGRGAVDLSELRTVEVALAKISPEAVIHTAAVSAVAQAHADPVLAMRVNCEATALLASQCPRLVYTSTDLVFDGESAPYAEDSEAVPLSEYGRTKLAGEAAVLSGGGAVVRVSLMFGPSLAGEPGFFDHMMASLREGRPLRLFEDEWRTPIAYEFVGKALVSLAAGDYRGLIHLGGRERLSRFEMGLSLAQALGVDPGLVVPSRRADLAAPEPRPRDVSLDSSRWQSLFGPVPGYLERAAS